MNPVRIDRNRQFLFPLAWCLGWVALQISPGLSGELAAQPPANPAPAQKEQAVEPTPLGQFLRLKSPITDEALGAVRRLSVDLQAKATAENRKAVLVLELSAGTSQFHHAYALAKFLTGEPLSRVTTVAFVPEKVTGYNVLVALACQEIVLHPDAMLGDIGRGSRLPPDELTIVRELAAKRHNKRVTEALALGLSDPALEILQLTIDLGNGEREKRLVTVAEARQLRDQGLAIVNSVTLKEAGTPWLISGTVARAEDILAASTAQTRREVADVYHLPLESLRERASTETLSDVAYIELKDEINPLFFAFAQRQIERVSSQGIKLIVFEIDSPGGSLLYSRDLAFLIADLEKRGIRSVAYIPREAISGGAIVALGCDEIYMHPDSRIGDAIPIQFEEGRFIAADGKVLSIETQMLRELAHRKNRPSALLEAMADANLPVFEVTHRTNGRTWYMSEDEIHQAGDEWLKGARVPESRDGVAITVSGRRAAELRIAEPTVADETELRERLGVPADLPFRRIGRTWVDNTVFILNNGWVTGFIFFLGIIFLYVELHTMTGLFGILSVLSFGIFFWSKVLGGTAGGLEIILFLIGLGCLAMEIFVIPGFGVFGVSGILLVLGSLVMASQSFSGLSLQYDMLKAGQTLTVLGVSLMAVVCTGYLLSHFLPKIPFLKDMVLSPPGAGLEGGPRLRPDLELQSNPLLGARGTALTVLRPAGKARLNGEMLDVVSDGPFIDQGAAIEVVQVAGNRIVVRVTVS